jgi:alkylhydroperoxidase family enzyme
MAKLLYEIEWAEPLLAPRKPGSLEEEAQERLSPWLSKAVGSLSDPDRISYAPFDLMGISYFVASQENACRYCYGMARAVMKIAGFKEKQIQDLEHEASLADGLTRLVVEFARKLARSNPSPARRDQEALLAAGLSEEAACEIAAMVVKACFANRIATFLALPPNEAVERLPDGLFGRIKGFFFSRKYGSRRAPPPAGFRNEGPCARIIAAAGRNPTAAWLRELTDGWYASTLLPNRSKLLIMAVIARQLGSQLCEEEATEGLAREGFGPQETQGLLATLSGASMTQLEATLLRWTRETVWYEPRAIQASTRRLLAEVGEERALEALGCAAFSNSLARLALVRQ